MSLRSLFIVFLSLVSGVAAVIGVNILRNAPPPPTETVPVVVATMDVPRFTTVSAEMLKTRIMSKDMAPTGAVFRVEDAVDRVAVIQLVMDEPLLDVKLSARGAGRGMAPGITKGMRAFTIRTADVSSGVAGFILPGAKVDVHLTVSGIGSNEMTGTSSTILLQNVEILAVDQRVEAPAENKVDAKQMRSVTLLVTPDQAVKLTLGQSRGTLHLSLRNPEDDLRVAVRPATLAELGLFQEKPREETVRTIVPVAAVVSSPPPLPPAMIRTLRGNQQGMVRVE